MNIPIISVIMPVYNGEKYIEKAINSIINQSYENFELIIINDGSTDNSWAKISSYTDKRIRAFEQTNQGFAKTLNIAASYCNGKYIARMDQDDISEPNRFLLQVEFLEKHSQISVVSAAVNYINETGEYLGRSFTYTRSFAIRKKLLHSGCVICHPCVMMKKNDFKTIGGYSEEIGSIFTDYHLWVKFIKNGYKLKNLSEVLINYRILESSMSSEYSLTPIAKKLLLEVITERHPNPNDIELLNNYCIVNKKNNFNKRYSIYTDKQNLIFSKLTFMGVNTKEFLFSFFKNFAALISLKV